MDFNVELKNGQVLSGIVRSPGENPKGVIVLVHGLGEHVRRYNHWVDLFISEKFAFAALDLPGHGKSVGGRGKVKKYSDIYESIDILLKTASRTFPGVPLYLYGHSMGGGIVLDYAVRFHPKVKGVIVTGPWLKLAFEPSRFKMVLATIAKIIMPNLVQRSGLKTADLSHDRSVVDVYDRDPLVHGKISAAFFAGVVSSAKYALEHAQELKVPTLIIHGGDDMICSPQGSIEFAGKTEMAELKIWEGGYHELHNEPFREEVFRYIIDWIRKPK